MPSWRRRLPAAWGGPCLEVVQGAPGDQVATVPDVRSVRPGQGDRIYCSSLCDQAQCGSIKLDDYVRGQALT